MGLQGLLVPQPAAVWINDHAHVLVQPTRLLDRASSSSGAVSHVTGGVQPMTIKSKNQIETTQTPTYRWGKRVRAPRSAAGNSWLSISHLQPALVLGMLPKWHNAIQVQDQAIRRSQCA